MPAPTLTPAAERLYEEFRPLADAYDADNEYALAHLCQFFATLIDPLHRLAFGADAPWGVIMDPDTATYDELRWLGQHVGVEVPPGLPLETARTRVKRADGQRRGTLDSLREAIQETLTGERLVRIIERQDGSAWRELIITRTAETPDPAAAAAAMRSDKIAGVVQTLEISDAPLIDEATLVIADVAGTVTIDGAELGDV